MGKGLLGDMELMKCLRRVNLYAFWSREPTTIKQNLRKVNQALQIAHELVMRDPPMPKLGPCKFVDEFGAAAALSGVLLKCLAVLCLHHDSIIEVVRGASEPGFNPGYNSLFCRPLESEARTVWVWILH
jgi:hypothetical protein